jgi:hypothetical protein
VPPPGEVAAVAAWALLHSPLLLGHLKASLWRVFSGYAVAALLRAFAWVVHRPLATLGRPADAAAGDAAADTRGRLDTAVDIDVSVVGDCR